MEITQEQFAKKLKVLDDKTKNIVLTIETNPAIFTLAESYDLDQDTTYSICNQINLQLMGFIKSTDVIKYVSNNTVIDSKEFESIYPVFFDNILKKSDEPLFKDTDKIIEDTDSKNEIIIKDHPSDSISHLDILSEIENPTPSINIKTFSQNRKTEAITPATSSTATKTTSDTSSQIPASNQNNTTPTPSLHSPTPIAPYTNPALHIATKLEQNLDGSTSSVKKDMYISKKPDPYHEPVDF